MVDNKQNSETENTKTANNNKTTIDSGAFSTKQAKDVNPVNEKTDFSPSSNVGDAGNNASDNAPESVGSVTNEAIGQVKDKATSVLSEQKTNLASGVASVADSIRQVGENLGKSNENNQVAALAGKYGDTLAGQIERLSGYLEDKEFRELVRDIEQFARRNPTVFVGSAFALGILAARFLRSSSGNQTSERRSQNNHMGNSLTSGNAQSSGV